MAILSSNHRAHSSASVSALAVSSTALSSPRPLSTLFSPSRKKTFWAERALVAHCFAGDLLLGELRGDLLSVLVLARVDALHGPMRTTSTGAVRHT
jgi:hypothetical protein